MYNNPDINSYINLKFKTEESPANGYAFVLSSISADGARGKLNEYILDELGLLSDPLPNAKDLANGFKLMEYGRIKMLYIVTVDGGRVRETFQTNLITALRFHFNDLNWPMWAPLLGTGVGKLSYSESFQILAGELERNENLHGRGIDMTISIPNEISTKDWESILKYTSASKTLNLRRYSYTELDLAQKRFKGIIEEKGFYFDKALGVIDKLKQYQTESEKRKKGKEQRQNRIEELYAVWNEQNQPLNPKFFEILKLSNKLSHLIEPFEIISSLVSYLEKRAWRGDELNGYRPRRYLAQTNHQSSQTLRYVFEWVLNDFDLEETADKTTNFYNLTSYLNDPLNNINIGLERHRRYICEHFLNSKYRVDTFEDELFKYFNFLKGKVANPSNFSFLISKIIYDRDIRFQWDEGLGVVGTIVDQSLTAEIPNDSKYKVGLENTDESGVDKPYMSQPWNFDVNADQPRTGDINTDDIDSVDEEAQVADDGVIRMPKEEGINSVEVNTINNPLQLATLSSDSAHQGQDLLGFKQDIEAFASIVALKELTPPLAIALFGQWGTGKSFFMQKLSEKVEELAETQGFLKESKGSEQEAEKQKVEPFCKGVCQIHFNAWSYMDTNLWASLVTRIFEGLDDYINDNLSKGEEEKARVKGEIAKQLDVAKGQLDELVAKKKQIEDAKEALVTEVKNAQKSLNDKVSEIKTSSKQGFIDFALHEFKVKEKLKEAFENTDFNLPEGENIDPDEILKELKSTHSFTKQLLSVKGFDWRWIMPLLIILLLVFFPIEWLGADFTAWVERKLDWVTKTGATILTFIGGAMAKVKQTLNKLSPVVNKVLEAKEIHAVAVQEGNANYEQDLLAKQIEADQKEVELNQLTVQLKAKEAEIKALEFSSESGLAHKAMYNFITRKAKSNDYTKHLGIISMIRKDFETLSELFVESRAVDKSKLKDKEKEKLNTYNSIRNNFEKPLERIVLYVDDLDRCPEGRVVEVLEAVNLLMAFPLFVVIVGVDPRWVKNALIQKYQLQFTGRVEGTNLGEQFDLEVINPSDYLEKIFQVPFHLMSPSNDSIKDMIEHLVGDSLLEEEIVPPKLEGADEEEPEEVEEMPEETDEEETEEAEEEMAEEESKGFEEDDFFDRNAAFDDVDNEDVIPDPDVDLAEDGPDLVAEAKSILDISPEETNSESEPALVRVTPESLKLHPAELQYMKDFSWLIGNTPRTVKRFVNMYRIIRAHEGLAYTDTKNKEDLMCIQFLLALQTGPYQEFDLKIKSLLDSMDIGGLTFGEVLKNSLEMLSLEANLKETFPDSKHSSLLKKLLYEKPLQPLRDLNSHLIFKHSQFIQRFRFQTGEIQRPDDLYEEEFEELEKLEFDSDEELESN